MCLAHVGHLLSNVGGARLSAWQPDLGLLNAAGQRLTIICRIFSSSLPTLSRHAQAGNVLFEEWQKDIDLSFGLATIVTAIAATLAGAWLVDHLGSSIRTSMLFCGISTLIGFGLLQAAFAIPDTFPVFLGLFALGEVACFAGTAPASETLPHLHWAVAVAGM